MSRRFNNCSLSPQTGDYCQSANRYQGGQKAKYYNNNNSKFYNQNRYNKNHKHSQQHHQQASPKKIESELPNESCESSADEQQALEPVATVPANENHHSDACQNQLQSTAFVPTHASSSDENCSATNGHETETQTLPLTICTTGDMADSTQSQQQPMYADNMALQHLQQQQPPAPAVYAGSFMEYDPCNVSGYMTMNSPPQQHYYHHHVYQQQQHQSPPQQHQPLHQAEFPNGGFYSPVYQPQQQPPFQPPPFTIYEQAPMPQAPIFMSPQQSSSQGNLFHTPQPCQSTQQLYLTTPPNTSSSECLQQQQQPQQPDQFQQQPYLIYHPYPQQSPSQPSLISPPLSQPQQAAAYAMVYHPPPLPLPHHHHHQQTPSPTPSSSMVQLVPNQHQQQTTPTSTRGNNNGYRSNRYGNSRRFNQQYQQQMLTPPQDDMALQIQQQHQIQMQMQQQALFTMTPNMDMSQYQMANMDPSLYGTVDAGVDLSQMPADVDPNAEFDDEDSNGTNGEPLACYVCRGRRMCFCYFLKVRYYKFPSFLDLVDHQYKKWRTHVAKTGRQSS